MKTIEITIVSKRTKSNKFIGFIPEFPGAFSQGNTEEELKDNLIDAVRTITAYHISISTSVASEAFSSGAFSRHKYAVAAM